MFYLIVITLYCGFMAVVVYIGGCFGLKWKGKVLLTVILLLAPFYDALISKGIMLYYGAVNHPLQKIIRTVDSPGSVFWLDEVWPGFDEYGRHWMVDSYLDGARLKTLALNGEDGRIYVYRATEEDFTKSGALYHNVEQIEEKVISLGAQIRKKYETKPFSGFHLRFKNRKEKEAAMSSLLGEKYSATKKELRQAEGRYRKQKELEVQEIIKRVEVYQRTSELPRFNYTIHFVPITIPYLAKQFLWCDEIRIRDNENNEDIAWSRRYMGYASKVLPNPIGKSAIFYGGTRQGDERAYQFDDKVLFGYAGVRSSYESKRSSLRK